MKLLLAALVVRAAARSLRSGAALPEDAAGPGQGQRAIMPLSFSLEDCYADPTTCGGAMDSLTNLSNNLINKVLSDRNQTQHRIWQAMKDFAACTPKYATTAKQYKGSLRTYARIHKGCRAIERTKLQGLKFCEASRNKMAGLAKTACSDSMLKKSPSPGVCKAPTQMSLKTLEAHFRNMKKQFFTEHMLFVAKTRACQSATSRLSKKTAECKQKNIVYDLRKKQCDTKLNELDQFACEWAQKSDDRRKNYYPCYSNALNNFNQLKAGIKSTMDANKEEYVLGMRMKCMATAVDSTGKVDIAKMKLCHSKNIDTSLLLLAMPAAPRRMLYSSPRIYPSSRDYYSKVYKILPFSTRKQLRPPTLCIAWKGGCAARSTFGGSQVYLKLGNKYCGLDPSRAIRCTGNLRKHKFAFVGHDTKCGSATLVAVNSKNRPIGNCRFAPDAPSPQIKCPRRGRTLAKARAQISGGNPPMISRSNTVGLKLAPLTNVKLALSGWSGWSRWDGRLSFSCGTNGALVGLWSSHNNRREDRVWRHRCVYFPGGVGSSRRRTFSGRGWTDRWGGWQNWWDNRLYVSCGSGSALVGHKSKHSNRREDRRFQFPCRRLPAGMKMDNPRGWDGWSAWDGTWAKQCNAGEVLVGLQSIHNNKKEDRIWKSKCARVSPRTPKLTSFKVEYASDGH